MTMKQPAAHIDDANRCHEKRSHNVASQEVVSSNHKHYSPLKIYEQIATESNASTRRGLFLLHGGKGDVNQSTHQGHPNQYRSNPSADLARSTNGGAVNARAF